MARALPIIAIVAAALAALTALVFLNTALLLPGLFALGAGIYLTTTKEMLPIIAGASAILFSLLGLLGVLNISTEDASFNLGITASVGHALILVGLLEISGASLLAQWGDMEPGWLQYVWVAVWAVAFILAFVARGDMPSQADALVVVTAVLSLAMCGPAIMQLRA